MEDNKVRCALVLQLKEGEPAVVLAKFDHARQCETHDSNHAILYGGQDSSFVENVRNLISSDPPSALAGSGALGGFKFVQSERHRLVYGLDGDGLCKLLLLRMISKVVGGL